MPAAWCSIAPARTAAWPRGGSASSSTASWRPQASPRRLLAQIAAADDDTLGALARRAGLEQSTLSRNLRTLEGGGLIEIALVESDLRRRAVWLTETGARRLEAAIPLWRKAHGKLARQMNPGVAQELAEAAEALIRV
jgi:DNA-binding MarR family transcriptional regulator